jgi:RNA polymerase sigma-70 factor, ECF subfamily
MLAQALDPSDGHAGPRRARWIDDASALAGVCALPAEPTRQGVELDMHAARNGATTRGKSEAGHAPLPPHAEADIAMDRYAAGDNAAFGTVYDALAPRLYGYLLRQARDRARAEDLLQQTFLHMHRARHRFIAGAEVTPWAFAIARRLLIDTMRRGKRQVLEDDAEPDAVLSDDPGADDLVAASELAVRLRRELARLPQSQRVAFELIKHEGLSMAEAAAVLGTTVAAVKLRAHRAYEALRDALGDVLGGAEGGKP